LDQQKDPGTHRVPRPRRLGRELSALPNLAFTLAAVADGGQVWARPKERLAQALRFVDLVGVSEPPLDRNDVNAIVGVLFDIKLLLLRIVELLGGEVDGEEEEDSDEP
jgi:hypothetical protein